MVLHTTPFAGSPTNLPPSEAGPSVTTGSASRQSGVLQASGLEDLGEALIRRGLPREAVHVAVNAWVPGSRSVYKTQWAAFCDWCSQRGENPLDTSVILILLFLQNRFDLGRQHSTIKSYVYLLGRYLPNFDGASLGNHPLISIYLRGARHLRPAPRLVIPQWDLSLVLA